MPCGYPLAIPDILQEFIHKPLTITFFTKYYHSFLRRLKIKNTLMDRKEEGNWVMLMPKILPGWLSGKESTCQCGRCGFNPWVRKIPWRRKCSPLQYSHLEFHWREEPCRLQSMRSQRVGHDLATKQQQQRPKIHWCWAFKNEKHRYGHYH